MQRLFLACSLIHYSQHSHYSPHSVCYLYNIYIYIVYTLLRKHTLRSCRIERVEIDDLAHGLVTQDRGEFSSRCSPRRQNKFACFGFLHSGRRDTLSSVSADQAGKGKGENREGEREVGP